MIKYSILHPGKDLPIAGKDFPITGKYLPIEVPIRSHRWKRCSHYRKIPSHRWKTSSHWVRIAKMIKGKVNEKR